MWSALLRHAQGQRSWAVTLAHVFMATVCCASHACAAAAAPAAACGKGRRHCVQHGEPGVRWAVPAFSTDARSPNTLLASQAWLLFPKDAPNRNTKPTAVPLPFTARVRPHLAPFWASPQVAPEPRSTGEGWGPYSASFRPHEVAVRRMVDDFSADWWARAQVS